MTSIAELYNHFMSLVGLKHYTKSESDNKYSLKSHEQNSSTITENSGLGRIGTSPNATQHEINVAINNLINTGGGDNSSNLLGVVDYYIDSETGEIVLEYADGKLIKSISKSSSGNVDTYTILFTDLSTYEFTVTNGTGSGGSGSGSSVTVDSSWVNNSTNPVQSQLIKSALDSKVDSNSVYSKNETYTQSEITTIIANAVSNLQLFEVVQTLPSSNIKENRLYLIVNGESIVNNSYDIYLRVNNAWEQIDKLEFDISNFYNKTEMDTLLNGKVNTNDSRLTDARTPTSHTHTTSEISNFPTIPTKITDLTNDSDFIETSNTSGLIKNDGTIDTNTYLTSHQSLNNYYTKSEIDTLIGDIEEDMQS